MPKFRIQPHVRLQEWVAEEHGLLPRGGPRLRVRAAAASPAGRDTAVGQPGRRRALSVRSGAFEDMETGRACDVSGACHWAVNAAATGEPRKDVGQGVLGVRLRASSWRPTRAYRRPEDLAGVEVGVGYHSGSHYSAIQGLEPFLERDEIALDFVGLPVRPGPADARAAR